MRALLLVVALIGCGITLPTTRTVVSGGTTVDESVVYTELCIEAVEAERSWRATSIVFNALGTASSGTVVASEFLTDEEWVPAAFSIGGLVFGGVGIGAGLVADDAAQDVLIYCTPVTSSATPTSDE